MRFPGRRVLYALGKPRVPPGFRQSKPGMGIIRQSKPGMGINRIPFGLASAKSRSSAPEVARRSRAAALNIATVT